MWPADTERLRTTAMDSAQFHQSRLVQETLNDRKMNYAFLIQSSPQLKPIEDIFATIKTNTGEFIHCLQIKEKLYKDWNI